MVTLITVGKTYIIRTAEGNCVVHSKYHIAVLQGQTQGSSGHVLPPTLQPCAFLERGGSCNHIHNVLLYGSFDAQILTHRAFYHPPLLLTLD